jgi:hypothetical protein
MRILKDGLECRPTFNNAEHVHFTCRMDDDCEVGMTSERKAILRATADDTVDEPFGGCRRALNMSGGS